VFGADNSVIGNDGDTHARFRDIMRHGYSRHALDGRYPQIVDVIDDWLERYCAPGAQIDAVSAIQHLTIGEIGVAVAGSPFFDDVDDLRTLIHWATNVRLLKRWPAVMLKLPKYRGAKARMDRSAAETLDWFRSRPTVAADDFGRRLLDDLVAANREDPEFMTDHELPFNLFIPFMAGLDTASNTIAAVLGVLTMRPDLLHQVRSEVDSLFQLESFDEETFFDHVPILDGVVKETMRMRPSVPVLMRHARQPFEFDGHRIEAGEPIMVATSVPHFLPEIFPLPDVFDPGRYRGDRREHMRPGAYSPFGRGPHLCLGKRIAEVLIPLSAARLIHQRQFELCDPSYAFKGRYGYGTELALNLKLRVAARA
jgi:cytochrome P450